MASPLGSSVLLVGNYLPSIAAARSLTRAGYRVIAGDGGETSTVGRSRSCKEVWRHSPIESGDEFLRELIPFLAGRPDISIVLPLKEEYVAFLARHHDRLPIRPVFAMPDPVTVNTCLDKASMYEIAREEGVPCLTTILATGLPALIAAAREVGYPCIVKPVGRDQDRFPAGRKAVVCADERSLARAFDPWPTAHAELLVQRYLRAPRDNVYFVARRGEVLAEVESRVLRTDCQDGTGINVSAVTVPLDTRIAHYCQVLASRLGYTGVGLFQFLMPRGDEPVFMELNPRHGMGLAFMEALGLDLTIAACALATGAHLRQAGAAFDYPIGSRYAWTSGELRGLWLSYVRGEVDRGGAISWLAEALRSAVRADVHATWSWRDPVPSISHLAGSGLRTRSSLPVRAD